MSDPQFDEGVRSPRSAVRRAHWADASVIGRTLGRAFIDDPLICHLMPERALRPPKLPRLFQLLFKVCERPGACQVTTGGEAAALWLPPNKTHIPTSFYLQNLSELLGVFGLPGGVRAFLSMDRIDQVHPKEPHWYLLAVGVDPDHQGKGYGSAILREQLRKADTEGLPAYLETGTPKNIAIYKGLGFETVNEIQLPKGPLLTGMWRKAQA